jgi:3-oxoadipate enol-lactonase
VIGRLLGALQSGSHRSPADLEQTTLITDDAVTLFVEARGEGPPLLMIQGLGYASWAWQCQTPELSKRLRVVTFDNRGAGRSEKPDTRYSIERHADDALTVLRHCAGVPAHVAGVSMGGYIAQMLASRNPEAVRSLILISTSCGGDGAVGVPRETLQAWDDATNLTPQEFARRTMSLSFAPSWVDEHAGDFDRILASRLSYPPTPDYAWCRQFDASARFLRRGLDVTSLEKPTLILHGTEDRVVPYENGRLLASKIAGSRFVTLHGAGHLAFVERADEVNRLILDFIGDVEQRVREHRGLG